MKKPYDYGYDFQFPCGYHPGNSDDADQYYFCEETLNNYVEIIESCCFHNKGKGFVGRPLILEKFQKDFIAALFCLKHKETGRRRYNKAMLYIPRKNGKSLLISALILAYLILDEEEGKEVVSAAGSRDQASLVFKPLKYSLKHADSPLNSPYNENPSNQFKIYATPAKVISADEVNEYFPITADADKQHGLNISFGVCDELHTWPLLKGSDLLEAMETSQGIREDPLIVHITTADKQGDTLCNREFNYALGVVEGKIKNSKFLPVLYFLDKNDDWKDPKNWERVNPNYHVMNQEKFNDEFEKALNNPVAENSFKRLRLNMQTRSEVQFLDFNTWVGLDTVDKNYLKGAECCGGLDLAFKTDMCALVLEFAIDGKYHLLQQFWIPEGHKHIEFYREQGWLDKGIIKTTTGNAIDFKQIKEDIVEFVEDYDVVEIGYDPKFATELCQSLQDDYDLPMVSVPQTTKYLSEPLKDIQSSIMDRKFTHDGNPCASWQVGNATAKTFDDGNIKLVKPQGMDRTLNKVDFIAALSIAHNRILFNDDYDVNRELMEALANGGSIL